MTVGLLVFGTETIGYRAKTLFIPSESIATSVAAWKMGVGSICKQHL